MGSDEKGLAYDPGLLFTTGLRVFFHSARDIYGSAARTLSVWKEIPATSTATAIGRSGDNFSVGILILVLGHVVGRAHSR